MEHSTRLIRCGKNTCISIMILDLFSSHSTAFQIDSCRLQQYHYLTHKPFTYTTCDSEIPTTTVFCDVPLYSLVKIHLLFGVIHCVYRQGRTILTINIIYFSETQVVIYQTTRRHISEERTIHSHCRQNLDFDWILTVSVTIANKIVRRLQRI